jgi:hypothetical protein
MYISYPRLFTELARSLFCALRPEDPLRYPYNGPVLGDTLRQARCAKGWSIPQVSKRSGVPERLIREMEGGSGTYVPSEANTKMPTAPALVPQLRQDRGCVLFTQSPRRAPSHKGSDSL